MGKCDTGGTSIIAPTWSSTLRRLRADFLLPDKSLPGLYPPVVQGSLTLDCQPSFLSLARKCLSSSRQGSFRSQQEQTKKIWGFGLE
ncbi:hypothetical protein BDP55DRAFT_654237, partial [Colletotrichum godetiae]